MAWFMVTWLTTDNAVMKCYMSTGQWAVGTFNARGIVAVSEGMAVGVTISWQDKLIVQKSTTSMYDKSRAYDNYVKCL